MQHALIQLAKLFSLFLFGFSLSFSTNTLAIIINFFINDLTPRVFIRGLLSLIRTMASSSLGLIDHLPLPIHQYICIPEDA